MQTTSTLPLPPAANRLSLEELVAHNQRVVDAGSSNPEMGLGGGPRTLSAPDAALALMRQLNPQCQDDALLLKVLEAHINSRPLELDEREVLAAGGKRVLMPVSRAAAPAPSGGFLLKHTFRIVEDSVLRECLCVKVVHSPEVLAVHQLLSPGEIEDLREIVLGLNYQAAVSASLFARVEEAEEEPHEFVVPMDGNDISMAPVRHSSRRTCEVAELPAASFWERLIRSRASAVCPQELNGAISSVTVERYAPGQRWLDGHFSHHRLGAVLIPLDTAPEGGLTFPTIGLQMTPLAGLGVWVPARYELGELVPDLRADLAIENPATAPEPLYYFVATITDSELVQFESDSSAAS